MLLKRKSNVETSFKLNLIPIMDAVFIFIFFLLFSAQFIKIFEHGGDVPVVSDAPEVKDNKKDPLNLKININTSVISITTGLSDIEYKRFERVGSDYNYKGITATLMEIKRKNLTEDYAIVIPQSRTKYELIVKVMDLIRFIPNADTLNLDQKIFPEGKIFTKLVLEPIE